MINDNNNSFLKITNHSHNGFNPIKPLNLDMLVSAREIHQLLQQITLVSPRAASVIKSQISLNPQLFGQTVSSNFFLKSLGFVPLNHRMVSPHWLSQIPQRSPSRPRLNQRPLFTPMVRGMRTPSAPPAPLLNASYPATPSAPPLAQMKIEPPPYQERSDGMNIDREAYDQAPPPSYQQQWVRDEFEKPAVADLTPPPAYSN